MPRIGLFLAAHPHDGGAFQYSLSVAEALARMAGRRVRPVAAYLDPLWAEELEPLGLECRQLPWTKGTWWLTKAARFGLLPLSLWHRLAPRLNPTAQAMAECGCNLWIYPCQDEWGYLGPGQSLIAVHDLMHRYERRFPEVSVGFKYLRRELHYRKICRPPNHILVDSETGKNQLMEAYGTESGRVHPLPFIAPDYIYEETTVEPPEGLPEHYLFYPAQFWSHKNHPRLIRALARARHRAPDMKLVLVGSRKNGYDAVHTLISEQGLEGHVVIFDYVENRMMPSLYRRARALVMPTFFGPTNIPPLEAFACGCPVAVSRIYGMPEQLGDAALYFDPESEVEISDALLRLWNDDALRAELSLRGREADRHWNRPQFTARLESIIESVAGVAEGGR